MDDVQTWQDVVRRTGSRSSADGWLRNSGWWRVFRDVYAAPTLLDGPDVRCRALRRVLPLPAALSHRTALWALGLDLLGDGLDVTVPRGLHLERRPGVRMHSAALPDEELVEVGGLLVVSPARAVVDVARRESVPDAVGVGDAVLRSGLARAGDLDDALHRASGLRGCVGARAALGRVNGRSESPMESRLRVLLEDGRVGRVEAQVDLYDDGGHAARVDLLVEGLVVIEFDGRAAHLSDAGFVRERSRQNRLLEAGCEVRRFTAADVYRRPAVAVCAEVDRAVGVARTRPPARLRRGADTLRRPAATPPGTRARPVLARTA